MRVSADVTAVVVLASSRHCESVRSESLKPSAGTSANRHTMSDDSSNAMISREKFEEMKNALDKDGDGSVDHVRKKQLQRR